MSMWLSIKVVQKKEILSTSSDSMYSYLPLQSIFLASTSLVVYHFGEVAAARWVNIGGLDHSVGTLSAVGFPQASAGWKH